MSPRMKKAGKDWVPTTESGKAYKKVIERKREVATLHKQIEEADANLEGLAQGSYDWQAAMKRRRHLATQLEQLEESLRSAWM